MVAAGKKVFLGEGLCLACHGENGKGLVGPDLTDDTWLHRTGSYEDIIHQIKTGTDASQSKSGQIMPPLGGSGISETKVRAVAAYVWSLSRRPAKKT
jgi:cytochrome c oxidase cbb3-type subunit 3